MSSKQQHQQTTPNLRLFGFALKFKHFFFDSFQTVCRHAYVYTELVGGLVTSDGMFVMGLIVRGRFGGRCHAVVVVVVTSVIRGDATRGFEEFEGVFRESSRLKSVLAFSRDAPDHHNTKAAPIWHRIIDIAFTHTRARAREDTYDGANE